MIKFFAKNKLALTLVSLLAAGSLGVAGYVKYTQPQDATVDEVSGNVKGDSMTNQPEDTPVTDEPAKTGKIYTALNTPILQKSSGNNGSVPAGALLEFTCEGQIGVGCQIILTDQNKNVIKLDLKKIADNGRGQYFARWEWQAKSGNWTVVAQVSDGSNTKDSAGQSLEVN